MSSNANPSRLGLVLKPALVTALLILVWASLAKQGLVSEPLLKESVLDRAAGTIIAGSHSKILSSTVWTEHQIPMLGVGVRPWIWAVFLLQLLWTLIPWASGYFSHEEKAARPSCLRFLVVCTLALFLLQTSNVTGRLQEATSLDLSGGALSAEILSGLFLGMVGMAALAKGLHCWGSGTGMGVVIFLTFLLPVGPRLPALQKLFLGSSPALAFFWALYYLACLAVLVSVIGWVQRQTVELPPQTLETRNRELVPVHINFSFLGLIPFWIGILGLGLLKSLVVGLQEEYQLYGTWIEFLRGSLSPESWIGTGILAILVWFSTYVTFHLLYPYHRLAKIVGRQEREVTDIFRPWLDSQLALYALYLVGILIGARIFLSTPFSALQTSPMILVLIVATLYDVRESLWQRVALKLEYGEIRSVATALGLIEARVIQTRLERSGVPAVLHAWTCQTVLPASVPGLGEVDVLVPASHLEKARAALDMSAP